MREKTETAGSDARTIRLAWWTSFLATVVVIAALGFVRSAQAMPVPGLGGPATAAAVAHPTEEEEEAEEEAEKKNSNFAKKLPASAR
ncbi:MAG: hypothetical protein H0X42_09480 [Solirubrobacterales bacterium]|nr:hypothetical protein [Solirubrobacterales bacterium]